MSLKSETVKLSLITAVNVIGGLSFHILMGRTFGLSWELDCYFVVLTLFAWLCLLNTFFTSLYIPVFSDVKKESMKEGVVFADVVLKWLVLISALFIGIVLAFKSFIIGVIAPGFTEKGIVLSADLAGIIVFALIFYSISHIVIMSLNALHFYSVPSLAGLVEPVLNISSVFILVPIMGVKAIAVSCLVSNMLKALTLLAYFFVKAGWRPTAAFYHPGLPELARKSSQLSFGSFVWSLKDIMIRNFASRLGEGSIALFSYAEKIIATAIHVVINPLARVFYSRISEWMPFARWHDIKFLFLRVVRTNVFLSFVISAGLIIFFPYVLKVIFYKSSFNSGDISVLSAMTNIMLGYFVIFSFEVYLARVVMAEKRGNVVAVNSVVGICMLFALLSALTDLYGVYGLPLGVVITEVVLCAVFFFSARRKLEIQFFDLITKFSSSFFVMGAFILLGSAMQYYISNVQAMLFIALPMWIVLYFLASKVFLKEELNILLAQ